jgi:hypothetical protein
MNIKVKSNFVKRISFNFAAAITLWPFGIYLKRDKYLNNKVLINHELIHWEQQKEMLGIFFYVIYLIEWTLKTGVYGKNAYKNISFERESNEYEKDLNYLNNRKRYAWINYL